MPARTLQELVALIRANPRKYSYASPGAGTPGHLVGEIFRLSLGLDLVHVPFNSAGLAVGSAVGGHTQICFASPSPAAQQVIEGRLRGLAVTSVARSQALPDVPTTAEAGYPAVAGDNWQGIVVPSGTPKAAIDFIHHEIVEIMALPDVKARLAVLGFEPVASTPEEFARHAKVEFEKWPTPPHEDIIEVFEAMFRFQFYKPWSILNNLTPVFEGTHAQGKDASFS